MRVQHKLYTECPYTYRVLACAPPGLGDRSAARGRGENGDGVNGDVRAGEPALPSLSLVIPAYNEAARIRRTLQTAWDYLRRQPYATELLLVDDGSPDQTGTIAEMFAEEHDGVRVMTIPHGGKAAALR